MSTKNPDDIRGQIREFVAETFLIGEEASAFGDEESFMQTGIIDSTGVLELTGFLEDTYGLTVESEEMTPANLDSIESLVNYISRKTA